MRASRGKQFDWSKPFKLIDSKTLFDEIEVNENEFIIPISSKVDTAPAPIQKK